MTIAGDQKKRADIDYGKHADALSAIPSQLHKIGQALGVLETLGIAIIDNTRTHIYANSTYLSLFDLPASAIKARVRFEAVFRFLARNRFLVDGDPIRIYADIATLTRSLAAGKLAQFSQCYATQSGREIQLQGLFTPDNYVLVLAKDVSARVKTVPDTESPTPALPSPDSALDFHVQKPIENKPVSHPDTETFFRAAQALTRYAQSHISADTVKRSMTLIDMTLSHLKALTDPKSDTVGFMGDVLKGDMETVSSSSSSGSAHQPSALHWLDPRQDIHNIIKIWQIGGAAKGVTFAVSLPETMPAHLKLARERFRQSLHHCIGEAIRQTVLGEVSLTVKTDCQKNPQHLMVAVKDNGTVRRILKSQGVDTQIEDTAGALADALLSPIGGRRMVKRSTNGGRVQLISIPVLDAKLLPSSRVKTLDDKDTAAPVMKAEPSAATEISHKTVVDDVETQAALSSDRRSDDKAQEESTDTTQLLKPIFRSLTETHPVETPFMGLSVLCVSNSWTDQMIVKNLIGGRVDRLYFAENGPAALDILNTLPIDIVIIDIQAEGMDGIETTIAIRRAPASWSKTVVIALTSDPDFHKEHICRSLGIDDVLPKPVTRPDMARTFRRALSRVNNASPVCGETRLQA